VNPNTDPSDIEPEGYDGFGAPIYPNQEDIMPTNLPAGFRGTGKPNEVDEPAESWVDVGPKDDDKVPTAMMVVVALVFGLPALAVVYSVTAALFWLGTWFLTNMP